MYKHALQAGVSLLALAALAGCLSSGGDAEGNGNGGGTTVTPAESPGRVFLIKPGPDATADMVEAMVQLKPKDVLRFDCGFFELTTGIQISSTEDVIIEGCGMDETFLSFRESNSQEGFLASNVRGVTVRNLTVGDSPGDAFKLKGVNHGTLKKVRAIWSSGRKTPQETPITAANYRNAVKVQCTDPARHNPANPNPLETDNTSPDYTVSTASGRYGIYPVESRNILVEETESIGASDAGIYVGQTNIAKIRKSRAVYNVFGFEIENVQDGEYSENLAECNTGGFLIYDLDNLTQYGSRSRMFKNVARNNNTYNFAVPGSIVANVPRGSGLITLAYDKIDVYD
ncbi:MAG TPA: parallel beta-helix domain-containing protein, partial [Limnobacter sp.]|nr:parallel beta-helix domain-containing protein [Limnobacter sp.]